MVSLFVEYTKGIPLMKAYPDYDGYDNRLKESVTRFGKSSRVKSKQAVFSIGAFHLFFRTVYGGYAVRRCMDDVSWVTGIIASSTLM